MKPEALNVLDVLESAVIVSPEYTKAVKLTRHIIANAQAMQASLYEVCKGLKEMRDGKLYKELGYQNFEDYCKNEVGLTRQQGYTYLKIAENLPEDFVKSTLQIGVQKLALLAKLDEADREEVLQQVNPNDTSVKELKAKIKELEAEKKQLQAQQGETSLRAGLAKSQRDEAIKKVQQLTEKTHQQEDEYGMLEAERDELLENSSELVNRIEELKIQLAEMPADAVYMDGADKIEELEHKIEELKEAHQKEIDEILLECRLKLETLEDETAGKIQVIENDNAIVAVYVENVLFSLLELKKQLKQRKGMSTNTRLIVDLQHLYNLLETYNTSLK
ncbi:MAG: hypothetical protein V3G42_13890 [Oscillospiraceae bacterium]